MVTATGVVLVASWSGLALVTGPASAAPAAGAAVCTISDPAMRGLSGLATTKAGFVTVNDNSTDPAAMKVFVLDSSCKRVAAYDYPGYPNRPINPEDVAIGKDGTIWVGDTGDDLVRPERPRIAMWKFHNGTGQAPPYRFTYPDGAHDAEAMVLSGDGTPVFVTKASTGPAGVYVPTKPLDPSGNPVPLRKVGDFQPKATGTANPLSVMGNNAVTGGAASPDGKYVVLRTYSDAYEWDVTGGDIAKAITTGTPRITPLPNEPMGEAIAYTQDERSFVTVGDQQADVKILSYQRASAAPTSAANKVSTGSGGGLLSGIKLSDVTNLVAAMGVIGALMVIGGVIGIRRGRARRRAAAAAGTDPGGRSGGRRRASRSSAGADYPDYPGYPDYPDGEPDYGGYGHAGSPGAPRSRHGSTYSAGSGTSGRASVGRADPDPGGRGYGQPRRDAPRQASPAPYRSSTYGSPSSGAPSSYGSARPRGSGRHGSGLPEDPGGRGSGGSGRVYGGGRRADDQDPGWGHPGGGDEYPPPRRSRH